MALLSALDKLTALRAEMTKCNIDAYLVFTCDAHDSEYTAAPDHRREFLTGFTGSAGTAIVGTDSAWLSTDGRYFLQAAQELDEKQWTLLKDKNPGVPTIFDFFKDQPTINRIGFDPYLTPVATIETYLNTYKASEKQFIPITDPNGLQYNLVDQVWLKEGTGKPDYKFGQLNPYDSKYRDTSIATKLSKIREDMKKNQVDVLVLSELDEVAWTMNLRAENEIPYCGMFLGYILVNKTNAWAYIMGGENPSRYSPDCSELQLKDHFEIHPYEKFYSDFAEYIKEHSNLKVGLSPGINFAVFNMVMEHSHGARNTVRLFGSPARSLKAVKSPGEIKGMEDAHVADGLALSLFLCWLDNHPHKKSLTEYSVTDRLEQLRREQGASFLSFPSISCVGPNAAIIHYRPDETKSAVLSPSIYLIDSGGHYSGGTTDVTRTVHLGVPSDWEKECYTRVLKGHIDLGRAIFPSGTTGADLDILARQHLYRIGYNYLHGTGHGVGAVLGVHEAPPSIGTVQRKERTKTFTWGSQNGEKSLDVGNMSKDSVLVETVETAFPKKLEDGMIMSDEPGMYLEGHFGIRIENVMVVEKAEYPHLVGETAEYHTFRMMTLVPYSKQLIKRSLLSADDVEWINDYHSQVRKTLKSRFLKYKSNYGNSLEYTLFLDWLDEATAPIV